MASRPGTRLTSSVELVRPIPLGRFAGLYAACVTRVDGGSALLTPASIEDGLRVQSAGAMVFHFDGSDERSTTVSELIEPAGFEVYGPAPIAAVDQLRREARSAGISLTIHPALVGGFLRRPG